MPIDLADNDTGMKHYLYNILADLHGKPPNIRGTHPDKAPPAVRWSVSHVADFHTPPEDLVNVTGEKAQARTGVEDSFFTFEVSSHKLPNCYQFRDREGEFVLYRDLKEYVRKYCHKTDIRAKGEMIEMDRMEFLKTSHCAMLDRGGIVIKTEKDDKVLLVKIDKFVKKLFNSEAVIVPR